MFVTAYSSSTWNRKNINDNSRMPILALLHDYKIWKIPLCPDCTKSLYWKNIYKGSWAYIVLMIIFIILGLILYNFSQGDVNQTYAGIIKLIHLISFGISILCIPLTILFLFLYISRKIKHRNESMKDVPSDEVYLAFLEMAEKIVNSEGYPEYIKPKFLNKEEQVLSDEMRSSISDWENLPQEYSEVKSIKLFDKAFTLLEEMSIHVKNDISSGLKGTIITSELPK